MFNTIKAWSRKRYGQPVSLAGCTQPDCRAKGTITSEVELHRSPVRPEMFEETVPVACIVTLEPDGRLGCLGKDESENAVY